MTKHARILLFLIPLLLGIAAPAPGATTTKYPQTYTPFAEHAATFGNTGDPDGGGALSAGTVTWQETDANPDSTITSDNSKGWDVTPNGTTNPRSTYVDLTNFKFGDTIPIGSTINSVEFVVKAQRFNGTGTDTYRIGALKPGVSTPTEWGTGSHVTPFVTNTMTITGISTSGSGFSLWAQYFTIDDVFSSSFGIRLRAETSHTGDSANRLDSVSCVIDYTPPNDPTPTGFIHGWPNIAEAFRDMRTGTVHVIGNGDSNWAYAGYGHRKGIEKALSQKFACKATGLVPINNFTGGAYSGYLYSGSGGFAINVADSNRNAATSFWGPPFSVGGANLTHPAGVNTITSTGNWSAYTFGSGDRVRIYGFNGETQIDGVSYDNSFHTITSATANTLVTSSDPADPNGTDLTGGILVTEVIPAGAGTATDLMPYSYIYVNDAGSISAGAGYSLFLSSGCPVNPAAALTVRLWYYTVTGGSGSFTLQGRNEATTGQIAGGPSGTPVAMDTELQMLDWSVSADATRTSASFGPFNTGGSTAVQGPFFGTWMQAIDSSKTRGFDFSTMFQAGGQSALDMLIAHEAVGRTKFGQYVQAHHIITDATNHTWLIVFQTGGNDRNEAAVSAGPYGGFTGDARNAYHDNILGLIDFYEDAITAVYPNDTVKFLLAVTHPHYAIPDGTTDDSEIVEYRKAAYYIADNHVGPDGKKNVGVLCFQNVATPAEWQTYYQPGDETHVVEAGMDAVWARVGAYFKRASLSDPTWKKWNTLPGGLFGLGAPAEFTPVDEWIENEVLPSLASADEQEDHDAVLSR